MTKPNQLPSGQARIDSLEMRAITKRFPGVLANDRVDFDVKFGEVHALGKLMSTTAMPYGWETSDIHPGALRAYREAGIVK